MSMVRLISLIFFLIFNASVVHSQQRISKSTSQIVASIAKKNCYESQFVGFAGSPSEQYANYQRLKKTASLGELSTLITHENAVVRVYSFKSLHDRDPNLAKKLSTKLLKDTAEVMTLQGYIGSSIMVKTYISSILKNAD